MLRILVVEDALIAQKIAKLVFKPMACLLDVAGTGEAALAYVRAQQYDVIFMDIGLPDMDGITLTKRIRQSPDPISHAPRIVGLTAHDDEAYRNSALAAGMNDFRLKPLTTKLAKQVLAQLDAAGETL